MNNKNDIFDTTITEIAKKALSPEQLEEYKKIGEYIFNTTDYKTVEMGSKVNDKPTETDILFYASEALKSGGDPRDLSNKEIQVLTNFYGDKWYENFGFQKEDIRELVLDIVNNRTTISRKQKRAIEKRIKNKL